MRYSTMLLAAMASAASATDITAAGSATIAIDDGSNAMSSALSEMSTSMAQMQSTMDMMQTVTMNPEQSSRMSKSMSASMSMMTNSMIMVMSADQKNNNMDTDMSLTYSGMSSSMESMMNSPSGVMIMGGSPANATASSSSEGGRKTGRPSTGVVRGTGNRGFAQPTLVPGGLNASNLSTAGLNQTNVGANLQPPSLFKFMNQAVGFLAVPQIM